MVEKVARNSAQIGSGVVGESLSQRTVSTWTGQPPVGGGSGQARSSYRSVSSSTGQWPVGGGSDRSSARWTDQPPGRDTEVSSLSRVSRQCFV